MPVPGHAVAAGRIGRRHAVLFVRHIERMAADPRLPSAIRRALDDRILDPGQLVAGKDGAGLGGCEVGGIIRLEQVDPPMLAGRLGAEQT